MADYRGAPVDDNVRLTVLSLLIAKHTTQAGNFLVRYLHKTGRLHCCMFMHERTYSISLH